jgi:hypothetical protein
MNLISNEWKENLDMIFENEEHEHQLKSVTSQILHYMILNDWKGACHESCGVLYVIFHELGIPVEWKVGEVFITNKTINGRPICFDHSWITHNERIIDIAIYKPLIKEITQPPTILNINLESLTEPNLAYDVNSGIEDSVETDLVKTIPLSEYFDNSPMDPILGTWSLITSIGKKVGLTIEIPELKKKYNGIFWK